MTHTRMQESMPSAIILAKNPRTSSLDELRTYQGNTLYLNNGDEFQIRLFNPLKQRIGVQIGINGDLSQGLLVLNPGEDVTLDRFLDDKSKMLYETYTIDGNNQAAVNAAIDNGIVNVNFYNEKKVIRPNVKLKSASRGIGGQQVNCTGSSTGTVTLDGTFNTFTTTNCNSRLYDDGTYSTLGNVAGMGSTLTSGNNVYFSQDISSPGVPFAESDLSFISDPSPEVLKETGRIEKGDESIQNFNEVNVVFETFSFYEITYFLKPTSERNSTTVTETKVRDYCPNCGYRVRNTRWNFCPKCGDEV